MILRLSTTLFLLATATGALAAGNHSGGHGHGSEESKSGGHGHDGGHMEMMAVGAPGNAANVDRTVEITMSESEDGDMLFVPDNLNFTQGETVRLKVRNAGQIDHEFVMDTYVNNMKHRDLMMKFPEMEHDDPNSITLAPGETGELIWTFANEGYYHFACLIPGHLEAGMHGPLKVAEK